MLSAEFVLFRATCIVRALIHTRTAQVISVELRVAMDAGELTEEEALEIIHTDITDPPDTDKNFSTCFAYKSASARTKEFHKVTTTSGMHAAFAAYEQGLTNRKRRKRRSSTAPARKLSEFGLGDVHELTKKETLTFKRHFEPTVEPPVATPVPADLSHVGAGKSVAAASAPPPTEPSFAMQEAWLAMDNNTGRAREQVCFGTRPSSL